MDIQAPSASKALKICADLKRKGKASLFRGQTQDWPTILPTFFRLSGAEREESNTHLASFIEWASAVPQMASYCESSEALTAIAQHYGIPTTFLDLTDSPEIALLFAKREHDALEDTPNAVIYCFSEADLNRLANARILRLDVANLWRLEAQHGLFLDFLDHDLVSQLRNMATRIYFPSERLTDEERTHLYPVRKSALENVLDEWFYRDEAINLLERFQTPIRMSFKRHSYPGAFLWRQMPEFTRKWAGDDERWFLPGIETVSVLGSRKVVTVPLIKSANLSSAVKRVRKAIEAPIRASLQAGELISFTMQGQPTEVPLLSSAARLLNRVWDGIRGLPYTADELVACMSLCAALVSMRANGVKGIDDWAEQLWGETELLDVAPVGGHISAGSVSRVQLEEAYSSRYHGALTHYFRRIASEDPRQLMTYIVDPWILFDFEPFKHIFIEQFIPSAVDSYWKEDIALSDGNLESRWTISFNPALLGYVTNSDFRFTSPLPLEKDPAQIVYIPPDMTETDLEEAFVYCLPKILEEGQSFQVRLMGYAHDSRQLWEIEQAVKQCQDIVSVSGISVLDVLTSIRDPSEAHDPLSQPGLGAFEVWLIAAGLMAEVEGKSFEEIKPLVSELMEILPHANADLESRARRWL